MVKVTSCESPRDQAARIASSEKKDITSISLLHELLLANVVKAPWCFESRCAPLLFETIACLNMALQLLLPFDCFLFTICFPMENPIFNTQNFNVKLCFTRSFYSSHKMIKVQYALWNSEIIFRI